MDDEEFVSLVIELRPELFVSKDGNVISYKGLNYYKACNEWVADTLEGSDYCVLRVGHPSRVHQAYSGITRHE